MTPDIADIIAGELKVSRATAYDMMREALREASPVELVERPCHVFNVTKTGPLTEWEPTTMAFALTDGKHALYTTPPAAQPAVPLTDEQIGEIGRKHEKFAKNGHEWFDRWTFARAIEAAHGIAAAPEKGQP
jgi:hypothetical protein